MLRNISLRWAPCLALIMSLDLAALSAAELPGFTPLKALPAPAIVAASEAFNPNYPVENLVKPTVAGGGGAHAEYASRGAGTQTFVDFDFGGPVRLGGFSHTQRRTVDVVTEAKLVFSDTADFKTPLATVKVQHVAEQSGKTMMAFPPVTARYVRWQVTGVATGRTRNVGGRSVQFFAAGQPEPAPRALQVTLRRVQVITRNAAGLMQPLQVEFDYPYVETIDATVRVEGLPARPLTLKFGRQRLEYSIAESEPARNLKVALEVAGRSVAEQSLPLPVARHLTVYVLPHSHTDIGYTAVQTDIEEKQINNLLQGIADAKRTASYHEGARFVWNVEVAWAADLFLSRLSREQQAEFFAAVKAGQVSVNGMYLNELTGLCRPEELLRLFRYATQIGERTGVPVDSAMISDVPGYTWGTVTAMAQAGIKYFSVAPNYFDRIGTILVEWENKPFWWVGPDGQSKVLVWIPYQGYGMSHRYGKMSPKFVDEFCAALDEGRYPYDIAYVRWAGHGDNAVPDPVICDFIKEWNAAHAWPRFVIASTSEAFRAFDQRYGDKLPRITGDWTPYWEDGAGSSAAETALNRASSDRLTQAETLWAMLDPKRYPVKRFDEAWNNVLLYSEHTWGANISISRPADPFTYDQWAIKQAYATTANVQSRQLLSDAGMGAGFVPAITRGSGENIENVARVDIYNTTSSPRTEVVLVPRELSAPGDVVTDESGATVPAQRLASRDLAILVKDLPAFAGRRYLVAKGTRPTGPNPIKTTDTTLDNGLVRLRLDEKTGAITELRTVGVEANLAGTSEGHQLNDYLYLLGDKLTDLQRNGPVKITIRDRGPLVASLLVESSAPGCYQLAREVRVVAGAAHVELLNTVDKRRLEAANYYANDGKESVNFAFPFNVPGGEIRLDLPFGVIRPEHDQIASACKNWLTVGRWADVANKDYGVTWVTLDAPLVQVGGVTARMLNSQTNPDVWRKKIEPTQTLYSWAMNNHWGTNYRAYQDGAVVFRFVVRPHRGTVPDHETSRFARGFTQPLVALPGRGKAPEGRSLLRVTPANVSVLALKPSDDGKALIVRLTADGTAPTHAQLEWARSPASLSFSDTSERRGAPAGADIAVPGAGVVTLRAEWP